MWCLGVTAATALDPAAEAEQAFEQAMLAIRAGQWAQAELLLERSLMLNPDHADARLELAGLLAARGRPQAARALIESLIADPRTPEAHRERLRAMLQETEEARARSRASPSAEVWAEAFVAWGLNPLARADLEQLTLTFPEGPITLPVVPDIEPGATLGLSLRRIVPGSWGIDAYAQRLIGSDDPGAYRIVLSGYLPGQAPAEPWQAQWVLQTQATYDGVARHAGGLAAVSREWRLSAGGFDEPDLSRRGAYLRVERGLQPRPDMQAIAFLGGEYAASGPPSFWRAGLVGAWQPAAQWTVLGLVAMHRDLSGYNPLLEGGVPREMYSVDLAVERAWRVGATGWQVLARLQASRRWSNLSLYEYRDAGVQLSLQRHWK